METKKAALLPGLFVNNPEIEFYIEKIIEYKQTLREQVINKSKNPGLATNAIYTIADENIFIDQGSYGTILDEKNKIYEDYILGILNSRLLDFIFKSGSGTLSGGYYSYQTKYLSDLPIIIPSESEIIKSVTTNVNNLNRLYKELSESKLQTSTEQLQNKIEWYEERINHIVYQLYGLTEEEIRIVEESN